MVTSFMGRPRLDVSGKKYGSLTATGESRPIGKYLFWLCACVCGARCWVTASDLVRGHKSSCGTCPSRETTAILAPLKCLYSNYKRHAENRGLTWELDLETFKALTEADCAYCGSKPSQRYYKPGLRKTLTYNGVDRVDNSRGYTLTNSVPCCKFCNLAKSRWPVGELTAWIKRIRGN